MVMHMPRRARQKSDSGIYHVMLRGVNQQQIFFDEEDNTYFLHCLAVYKNICGFELYGYCLMGNHVHLLLCVKKDPLDAVIKRVGSKYVYWYNAKYDRVGHLFQDRFKSEPVETDAYFITVLRYIHQNPVKAGIVDQPEAYRWSSYGEYLSKPQITDTEMALEMIGAEMFVQYHKEQSDTECLEVKIEQQKKLTDTQLMKLLKDETGCVTAVEFQTLSENKMAMCIEKLYRAGGSIRQISRLTGCSKNRVERWLK